MAGSFAMPFFLSTGLFISHQHNFSSSQINYGLIFLTFALILFSFRDYTNNLGNPPKTIFILTRKCFDVHNIMFLKNKSNSLELLFLLRKKL